MVRVSSILNVGPALLFDVPATLGWEARVRAARDRAKTRREEAAARRLLAAERRAVVQERLPFVVMPRTIGDCRGEGICPVLRCRYNLALWVKDNGSIKVGRAHEKGRTLRMRTRDGKPRRASDATLERMADLVVELADRLPSLCVIDYAELGEVSLRGLAEILGCDDSRARAIVIEAGEEWKHAVDIAEAKARRQGRAARGASRSPLVNIRKRPGPALQPGARELDKVGTPPGRFRVT